MASSAYISGRKKYARPQALLFSNNPGEESNGIYVPFGNEVSTQGVTSRGDFIILSDHSRSPLEFGTQRIENRQRMVNGRMRSYFIADKRTLSVSWEMLPSRSFSLEPNFSTTTGKPTGAGTQYTIDGGAGGAELLDWYNNYTGTFYVFVAYDKLKVDSGDAEYAKLARYTEVLEMYITDFQWSVETRGANNFDMWNISISLEEA
jgi:hypothetical protein